MFFGTFKDIFGNIKLIKCLAVFTLKIFTIQMGDCNPLSTTFKCILSTAVLQNLN